MLFLAQPGNDRHCGAASAPRPGLAKSSAIEGTAVMRRRGRVRLFMTPNGRQLRWPLPMSAGYGSGRASCNALEAKDGVSLPLAGMCLHGTVSIAQSLKGFPFDVANDRPSSCGSARRP